MASQQFNVESRNENITNAFTGAQEKAHEYAARAGIVQPNISEEIKFGAEKMGTAVPSGRLHEMKQNVQETVQDLNDTVKENLNKATALAGAPGPVHELGARVGLVEPTMSEEIKFGAEKMGTAGPYAKLNEVGVKTKENMDYGYFKLKEATENIKEKGYEVWNKTQDIAHEHGARMGLVEPTMSEEIKFGAEKIGTTEWTNIDLGKNETETATTPGPLHELGARVGFVEPTLSEEIKFGAEKMGTAGPYAKLNEIGVKTKENMDYGYFKLKGATENLWKATQETVLGLNDKVHELGARVGLVQPTMSEEIKFGAEKIGTPVQEVVHENVEAPGTFHELGARVGLVEPTMAEEIKFGAEKMGTAGPYAKLNEIGVKTKENMDYGYFKLKEATENLQEKIRENVAGPGPVHELGARVGLVEPTMSEEIKFGAEKMGTAGPAAVLNEVGVKTKENMDYGYNKLKEATENLQEKGKDVWNKTQDIAHEQGARAGLVEPTMSEEIKFTAESIKRPTV